MLGIGLWQGNAHCKFSGALASTGIKGSEERVATSRPKAPAKKTQRPAVAAGRKSSAPRAAAKAPAKPARAAGKSVAAKAPAKTVAKAAATRKTPAVAAKASAKPVKASPVKAPAKGKLASKPASRASAKPAQKSPARKAPVGKKPPAKATQATTPAARRGGKGAPISGPATKTGTAQKATATKPLAAAKPAAKSAAAKPVAVAKPTVAAKAAAVPPQSKPSARAMADAKSAAPAPVIAKPAPAAPAAVTDKKPKPEPVKKAASKPLPRPVSNVRKVINLDEIKLPAGYKPAAAEEYMCPEHLAYFKNKLENWRQELINESQETLEHLRTETRDVGDEAERANRESDNILELRTRDRYRKLLNKIEQALKRIGDGSYGYCEETGEEIGLGRLEARPIATLTVDAQERRELLQRQFRDDH